jgi:hypothetical protein
MIMTITWLRAPTLPPDGITWMVPIAPGRELTFTLWTHDLAFSEAYTTGGLTRQQPGPLRMTIWYQNTGAGTRVRLIVLRIQTWPLILGTLMIAMIGGLLWIVPSSARRPNLRL